VARVFLYFHKDKSGRSHQVQAPFGFYPLNGAFAGDRPTFASPTPMNAASVELGAVITGIFRCGGRSPELHPHFGCAPQIKPTQQKKKLPHLSETVSFGSLAFPSWSLCFRIFFIQQFICEITQFFGHFG
jgi:hypothetical protein